MRLVRPARSPGRHAPRRSPGLRRSHPAQRARRPFLRRAGPDLAQGSRDRQITPHDIPGQVRAFEAAFGRPLLDYKNSIRRTPSRRRWRHWARWKLGFMDAAWKDAKFGVSPCGPITCRPRRASTALAPSPMAITSMSSAVCRSSAATAAITISARATSIPRCFWSSPERAICPGPTGICPPGTATPPATSSAWNNICRSRPISRA